MESHAHDDHANETHRLTLPPGMLGVSWLRLGLIVGLWALMFIALWIIDSIMGPELGLAGLWIMLGVFVAAVWALPHMFSIKNLIVRWAIRVGLVLFAFSILGEFTGFGQIVFLICLAVLVFWVVKTWIKSERKIDDQAEAEAADGNMDALIDPPPPVRPEPEEDEAAEEPEPEPVTVPTAVQTVATPARPRQVLFNGRIYDVIDDDDDD
jgi:hypothetical protein